MSMSEPEQMAARDVTRLLQGLARERASVNLAYWGNSRAGAVRKLVVASVDEAEGVFNAHEPADSRAGLAPKQWQLRKVLWAEAADGQRAVNEVTSHYCEAFLARQQGRVEAVAAARAGETPVAPWMVGAMLLEGLGSAPDRGWRLLMSSRDKRSGATWIGLASAPEKQRVLATLEFLAHSSEGRIWEVLDIFLKAGVTWPTWRDYHNRLVLEGRKLRGKGPRLRESLVRDRKGGVPYAQYMAQQAQYEASRLRPAAYEQEGLFVNRVRLFEADAVSPAAVFDAAQRVDGKALAAYLISASENHRLRAFSDESFDEGILQKLLKAQLVVGAREAPLQVLIQTLPPSMLPDLFCMRRIPEDAASDIVSHNERTLRADPRLDGLYAFMPPAPWDWEQLQDFRTCYVEMLRELVRWVKGEDVACARAGR